MKLITLLFTLTIQTTFAQQSTLIANSLVFPRDTFGYASNEDTNPSLEWGFQYRCKNAVSALAQRSNLDLTNVLTTQVQALAQTETANLGCALSMNSTQMSLEKVYMGKKGWAKAQNYAQELYQDPSVVAVAIQRRSVNDVGDLLLKEYIYVLKKK